MIFISVFVGAFIIVPIAWVISGKISRKKAMEFASLAEESKPSLELKCSKCGTVLSITDNYCINCGQMVDSKIDSSDNTVSHRVLKPSDFDSMYDLSDDGTLLEFIKRQMVKLGVEEPNKLVPVNVFKEKENL
ncbi:MAG: zinc ribbon domain-containing protein [Clostridium sp.]|nr:MAG: zinc ribbon domain-containing protein [Clostridium sp.]